VLAERPETAPWLLENTWYEALLRSEFLDSLTWYDGAPDTSPQSKDRLVAVDAVDVRLDGAAKLDEAVVFETWLEYALRVVKSASTTLTLT
jgi:hypothetical protein